MDDKGRLLNFDWCSDDCPKEGDPLWKADDTFSVTTHFENDVDIRYMMNEEDEAQPVYLDIVRVSSSGPAAELYPDSLGEYRLLPDITHNDHPVYQHSARDDRFIIQNGIPNVFLLIKNSNSLAGYSWFITHEISNSGLREFSTIMAERGHLVTSQSWKYNKYPNCRTIRQG